MTINSQEFLQLFIDLNRIKNSQQDLNEYVYDCLSEITVEIGFFGGRHYKYRDKTLSLNQVIMLAKYLLFSNKTLNKEKFPPLISVKIQQLHEKGNEKLAASCFFVRWFTAIRSCFGSPSREFALLNLHFSLDKINS